MIKEDIIRIAQGLITDFKVESDTMVDFCNSIIKELEQQPSIKDMEEIKEVINCGADAGTKCKMISNIFNNKPHYFEKQQPCDEQTIYEKAYKEGYDKGWSDGNFCGKHEQKDVLGKLRAEIVEEKDCAYADFEQYKVDYLGQDWEDAADSLPQDDFRFGMERAIELINKHMKGD